jgi:CO/xanthine dehydrogenase Mo-binding subunit
MGSNPSLNNSPDVDDWIAIDGEGKVHVRSGKVDIGQRISRSLSIIVAEELEMDPADIVIEPRTTGESPNEGMTAGSNSIEHSGNALRLAAATVRHHLLGLAADSLATDISALRLDHGLVRETTTNRTASLKDLAGGKPFGMPVDLEAPVKSPDSYRLIGKAGIAGEALDRAAGKTVFVQDMVMEGMWHARVVRPPHSKARLVKLDGAVRERLEARDIAVLVDGSFVAVAGSDEYAVIRACNQLSASAEWDPGSGLDNGDIFQQIMEGEKSSFPLQDATPVEEPVPDLPDPADGAVTTLSAVYERPYQMHASIGPSAALAIADDDGINLWTHSQGIYPLRNTIAEVLAVDPTNVIVHHALGAGCYGHNGADDAAFEAVLVARALPGRPILLKWSRDDEHAWEPYATAMVNTLQASLDGSGQVIQWSAESYGDSHSRRPRPGANKGGASSFLASPLREGGIEPGPAAPSFVRHGGLHRNLDPYYRFPERRLVKNLVRGLPLRTSAMRALGAVTNIFAIECFMDELAEAAGADPVRFRLDHIDDERASAVIEAAAEGIGWRKSEPEYGTGQGIAFGRYKNAQTYAAVAIELEVDDAAQVHLKRAIIAADAGEVIDPDGVAAQLEGGLIQAASWALCEQVTYDREGITSRDWESYPILRFDNVPEVETLVLDRPGVKSLGAGEATSGPTVAAIANAIHHAVGLRMRRMPFNPDAIRAAAMAGEG